MKVRRGLQILLLVFSILITLLTSVVYVLGVDIGAPAQAEASSPPTARPSAISTLGSQFWQSEIVEMPGYFDHMSDHSSRFDSAGNLHMVYGGDRLYYAKSDGDAWQVQIVDPDVGTGMGASIDLDSADRPHISYLDLPNANLKYAHWNGESWELQVVDRAYPYQERTSIAIDSADQPHIAYRKMEWLPPHYSCPGMGHAHWSGSQWQIDRFSDCGGFASLALDSADKPHISFYLNGKINHATNLTGTWTVDMIGSSNSGYGSSVAVDSQDRSHAVYVDDESGGQLIYAYWDGSDWVSSEVQPSYGGLNLSITLDVSDTVHIADGSDYIVLNGGAQQELLSPTYNEYSTFSSIALDGAGRPAISYRGFGSLVICKRWDGAEWSTSLIDEGANSGWENSLAIDSNGEPHISYYGSSGNGGGAIRYAFRSGEAWITETIAGTYIPSILHSGYHTSLALDSNDNPHASFWYSEYYTDGLYYGYRDGDLWQLEMIADDTDSPSKLVLDSSGHPHVSFVDNGILKYGHRTDDEWVVDDIVSDSVSLVADLALDAADDPRILFVSLTNGSVSLKYAAWVSNAWEVGEIPVAGAADWVEAALSLDLAGKPYVAFVAYDDDTAGDHSELNYATKNGALWEVEFVDSRRWSIGRPAIFVNGSGNPTIIFPYNAIHIATRSKDTWAVTEALGPIYGSDFSFEVHGSELFASYYHERGHGLILAGPGEWPEHLFLPQIVK